MIRIREASESTSLATTILFSPAAVAPIKLSRWVLVVRKLESRKRVLLRISIVLPGCCQRNLASRVQVSAGALGGRHWTLVFPVGIPFWIQCHSSDWPVG
ncbi:MAG: hypothetical protein OSB09_07170 [Planctomycetota bacterium]|nr:hypothetical protein [Planctomycetota bacterium]